VNSGIRVVLIVLCAAAGSLQAARDRSPFARVFDTGSQSDKPLSADALTKMSRWKLVPEDNLTHRFSGDAAIVNGKLAVVVRPKTGGIEVYSLAAKKPVLRASLVCAAGQSSTAGGIGKLALVENASSAVTVAATFAPSAAAIKFRLTTGANILEIQPPRATSTLTVVTKARYVVVPDFFANDMIFDARSLTGAGLPAENFFLNLIEGQDSIMMCVWRPRRLSASAAITGAGKETNRCSNTIECVEGKSVWLAFLEGAGIWHQRPGNSDWKPPFAAKWRCSQGGLGGFARSWDLGLSPTTREASGFRPAPTVIYPIDRVLATPMTVYCPTDVLRNTLGVGPCEHILATEGLAGPTNPTPDNVMAWIMRQFKRRRGRPTPDEVRKRLAEMTAHIARARVRMLHYRDMADAVLTLCKDSKATAISATARQIGKTAAEGLFACGHVEGVEQLAAGVLALVDKPDAAARCEPLAAQLHAIGAAQNRTFSQCRLAACWLRQQCAAAAKKDPKVSALAEKIRRRVERILK
jgi:hypothetical protein